MFDRDTEVRWRYPATAVHAAYLLRQRLEAGNRGLEINVGVRDGGLDGFAQLLVRLVIRKSFVNGEDGHFEGADGVGREHAHAGWG